jgi:hypothetical protein
MAQFFAAIPVHLERSLSSEQIAARAVFIQAAAAHWPPGPMRPGEIVALVERYGEPG